MKPRQPAPLPDDWKPFQASSLLLDLDAEDSPHVRPYDGLDEVRQRDKWAGERNPTKTALLKAAKEFKGEFRRAHAKYERLAGLRPQLHQQEQQSQDQDDASREELQEETGASSGKWLVNDLDLMTAALQGYPEPKQSRDSPCGLLKTVVGENTIPLSATHEGERLLDWLLHRYSLNAVPVGALVEMDLATVGQLLGPGGNKKGWRKFSSWRRLVNRIAQTEHGLALLGECGTEMVEALTFFFKSRGDQDMLVFLNNLRLRFYHAGFGLSPELSRWALVLAARAQQFEVMRTYLSDGLELGYWDVRGEMGPETFSGEFLNRLSKAIVLGRGGGGGGGLDFDASIAKFQGIIGEEISQLRRKNESI